MRVLVSGAATRLTNGHSSVQAEGTCLRSLIADIEKSHPGFAAWVAPPDGRAPTVSVYVNGTNMNLLAGLETAVSPTDKVIVLTPMSGG